MSIGYISRRLLFFVAALFIAATLNFFLPRITGQNPIQERLQLEQAVMGRNPNFQETVRIYTERFGLDKPLWQQYFSYLSDIARLDLGTSIIGFPTKVTTIVARTLPWTVGLLLTSTLISFVLGTLGGAIIGWGNAPRALYAIVPFVFTLSAVPYFILGLILVWLLAYSLEIFPAFGGYQPGTIPLLSWRLVGDILYHSILPALAIVLSQIGFWALSMRGMMVTTKGEDFINQAEANGLKPSRIFVTYALRNAILPQTTGLALSLAHIVSGAVLVEVVFAYPGIGRTLLAAIQDSDYFLIQGITFFIIVAIALSTTIIDIIYPLIDPRINYRRA